MLHNITILDLIIQRNSFAQRNNNKKKKHEIYKHIYIWKIRSLFHKWKRKHLFKHVYIYISWYSLQLSILCLCARANSTPSVVGKRTHPHPIHTELSDSTYYSFYFRGRGTCPFLFKLYSLE